MKRTFLVILSITLMGMLSVMAQTLVPTTSTEGNDVWYYIKLNPRNVNDVFATWATVFDNDTVRTKNYTGGDEQLWKVVVNGDGLALVNKKDGFYMNVDYSMNAESTTTPGSYRSTKITVVPDMPTNALRILPTTAYTFTGTGTDGWLNGRDGKSVFIIDNSVTQVDATNLVTLKKDGGAPFSFCFTSMGSPSFAPANVPGWAASNPNHPVFFCTQAEATAEIRRSLTDAIAKGNTLITNSSVGLNPGQFSSDVIEGLQGVLDAAQDVHDDTNATIAEIKDLTLEVYSVIAAFTSQVNLPELSSAVDNWYYIQGTRPDNTYLTAGAAGAGTQVKSLKVIPNETQLWRLVKNGEGFSLQNKATMEYLQTDFPTGTNLSTQTAMPTLPLIFKGSTQTTNNTLRFLIENIVGSEPALRLHAGGSGNGWGLMNWTGNANDNCSWLLLSEDEIFRVEFNLVKQKARATYDVSIEGVEFGQYSTAARAEFEAILVAEEAKDISAMSQAELTAATTGLNEAIAAFNSNGDVSSLASLVETKWFRFVNNMTSPGYAWNKAMSSNGRLVDQKHTFETINLESDAQLFRFELNADKTAAVAIINKANNMYVGANGMILAEMPTELTFDITRLDANSFLIKPAGNSPLHCESGGQIVNWDSGAGSASAWRIVFVKSVEVDNFVIPFNKAKTAARDRYNAQAAFKGAELGQYTIASMDASNAIIAAEEAKDPSTMSKEELIAGIIALGSASDGLMINNDIKLLVTANPAISYNWYRLVNGMSGNGYASGKAMSSNGRLDEEKFAWEDKDMMSDAQLFRFELNATQTKVSSIYNKSSMRYVDAYGAMMPASTVGNEFEITQLENGRSFWIHPTLEVMDTTVVPNVMTRLAPLHAASAGSNIVNWDAGVGSASAWYIEYVTTEYLNALDKLDDSTFKVKVSEGVVTVDGVENFDIYSITGQRQNHKAALKAGVYVIKVNNMTKKLVIR